MSEAQRDVDAIADIQLRDLTDEDHPYRNEAVVCSFPHIVSLRGGTVLTPVAHPQIMRDHRRSIDSRGTRRFDHLQRLKETARERAWLQWAKWQDGEL